jgi:hypothetical protein
MRKRFSRTTPAVVLCAMLCGAGGCSPALYDALLPADLAPALAYVYHNPAAFSPPTQGVSAAVQTGTVVGDLHGLAGCWGAYVPNLLETDLPSAHQINEYDALQLAADGTYTRWTLSDYGGLFPVVGAEQGQFQIVGQERMQFTVAETKVYDPTTGTYLIDQYNPPIRVDEYLATLAGNHLKLRRLDEPGAPVPNATEPDYSTTFTSFPCPG